MVSDLKIGGLYNLGAKASSIGDIYKLSKLEAIMSINDLYEEQRQQALSIPLQKNVLTTCDFHEDEIYEGGEDIQSAYKYANYLFSKGGTSFPFDNRSDMTETIKSVYGEYCCDTCPSCERHMDD